MFFMCCQLIFTQLGDHVQAAVASPASPAKAHGAALKHSELIKHYQTNAYLKFPSMYELLYGWIRLLHHS